MLRPPLEPTTQFGSNLFYYGLLANAAAWQRRSDAGQDKTDGPVAVALVCIACGNSLLHATWTHTHTWECVSQRYMCVIVLNVNMAI